MTITYPLSLPNTSFASIVFRQKTSVAVTRSPFSGIDQKQRNSLELWEADVSLPRMSRASAEDWISFLLKLNGKWGTFLMGDNGGATARGVATGTPQVNGASQTGNSLNTKGWTTGTTNILRAGDYIQLGTGADSRLYKNLNDVNSDGSGNATLDIWPDLRSSPSDSATITVSNTVSRFRLTQNMTSWSIDAATIYGLQFSATEAI